MRGMTWLAIAAIALVLAALAACSGGDEEGLAPGVWVAWAPGTSGDSDQGAITLVHAGDEPAMELPQRGRYALLNLSPDGTRLAAVRIPTGGEGTPDPDESPRLQILALPGGDELAALDTGSDVDSLLHDVRWSPDGSRLLTLYGNAIVMHERDGTAIGRREHGGLTTRALPLEWAPDSSRALALLAGGFIIVERDGTTVGPVAYDEIDEGRSQWGVKEWPADDQVTLYSRPPASPDESGDPFEAREYTITFSGEGLADIGEPETFHYGAFLTELDRTFRETIETEYGEIRHANCLLCYKRGQGLIQRAFPYPQPTVTGGPPNRSTEWHPDTSIHVAVAHVDELLAVIDLGYFPEVPVRRNIVFDAVVVE